MFGKHGYSENYEGCRNKRMGWDDVKGHTEVCRKRLYDEIAKTPEGRRVLEDREERILEKMAEHVEAGVIIKSGVEAGEERASRSHRSQIEERNDSDSHGEGDAKKASEEEEEDIGMQDEMQDAQEFVDVDDVDNNQMLSMIIETIAKISEEVDIAEIYSPPRVTSHALEFVMKTGLAMEPTTGWDFTVERHREAAR